MGSTVSSVATTVGGPHALRHAPVQGLDQVGHVPTPDRLRGARNLESLPRENIFQPVERQIIGKLTRHDIGQQPRPRQTPLDRRIGPRRHPNLRRFSRRFAGRTGVLLADMLQAHEVAGHVFDLPAFLGADLFSFRATARAGTLFCAQLVDVRGDREVRKVRQGASSPAPLHPPQLGGGLARRGDRFRGNRLLRQFFTEVQQRLPELLAGFQPVGPRAVVPLLVALQF